MNTPTDTAQNLEAFMQGYSIEVMPRTAAKIEDFRTLLPKKTRVYIAHIEGTPIEEMVQTAARLKNDGFQVMPHFPARIIKDKDTLRDWISRYQDKADVKQALLLAGGIDKPHGDFNDSMQLLETGLFDQHGFTNLHIAGHPEGNKDIDPDGSTKNVDSALLWKQEFSKRTAAQMAVATQFCFDAQPVITWADALADAGFDLPIHIGVAGPAKLQTMIKFSVACGVGASLRVLQRRARDITKLLLPFTPDTFLQTLANHRAQNPDFLIRNIHFFPLGGIKTNATWAIENGGKAAIPANAT